jgi:preprotein translocase subunit SecE
MWGLVSRENGNNNEKDNLEKESGPEGTAKKASAINKEKRALAKKDSGKDSGKAVVKKEKEKEKESGWFDDLKRYLRGVVSEVKKVHWLGSREVVIYTIVVLVTVLFVGSLIWLFDSLLTMVLQLVM